MHSLAIYCKNLGMIVSGSDIDRNKYVDMCENNGIKTYIKHKRKNIDGADIIVYTLAVDECNIEIIEGRKRGIKVVSRAELLECICKNYKCVIGVSGTHGKTTTSAMIYHILKQSGEKVSCHIGGEIDDMKLNPHDKYLVLECCEYNRSFLKFNCDIAVVLNIDNDHLDCYGNMYNLKNAFKTFIKRAKTKFIFDNPTTKCIKLKANHIYKAKMISLDTFEYYNKKYIIDNVFGSYNIDNATVAIAICSYLGVSYTKISKAIKSFKPVKRRCELLGKLKGVDVITDYAHHPTEIKCLYQNLQLKYNNIYLIFQPHTYSRTKLLIKEFVQLFKNMPNFIIFKEYKSRENKYMGYSAKQLSENVENSIYVKNYSQLKKILIENNFLPNSCIAFIGAGDINEIANKIINDLGERI